VKFRDSLDRLDGWQQRRPALAIPVAVIKKFSDDGADRLGVQIAYWGFFSIFALLLVFASVLGFVFDSNPDLQKQLLDSTLERMPVIGPQISGDIGSLTGSGFALAAGALGALWTGLGVTLAIGNALDRIWAVPAVQRPGFISSRLRGLLVLLSVGAVNVLATVAVGLVTAGGVGTTVTQVLGFVASAVIDLVLFTASFRLLTAAQLTTREVLPGALLAAGFWLGLQALGGAFVTQVLAGSSQTYGGFAAVIGLLSWLLIASELILIAAELNVVLAQRLWPRSLTGVLLEADRQTLRASAHAAQIDRRQQIEVSFEPPAGPADVDEAREAGSRGESPR
jgi:membrane protein